MVFLDESGKRWKRIKIGTGVLSTSVLVPVGLLATASLLYLPSWNGFSVPLPFHANPTQKAVPAVLSATTEKSAEPTASKPSSSVKSTGANSALSNTSSTPASNQTNATPTGAPLLAVTTPTPTTITPSFVPPTTPLATVPVTPPTTTTVPTGQAKQPAIPGNSDYGHTHQPIKN